MSKTVSLMDQWLIFWLKRLRLNLLITNHLLIKCQSTCSLEQEQLLSYCQRHECKGLLIVSYVSSTPPRTHPFKADPVLLTASQAFINEWPWNEPFVVGFQLSALSFARVFLSDDEVWPGRDRITTEESHSIYSTVFSQ